MLNLHKIFKENNKTKQGKAFGDVVAAIHTIAILAFAAAIIVYAMNHGSF